ncbi:MAG: DUF502 domain-containing protein [Campylobacterota bacterium]|nr:DUF502 domain-containing protein [Campylobacterota bacterium]
MKQFFRYLFVGSLALIPFVVVVQLVFWVHTLSIDLFDYVSSYTNNAVFTLAIISATVMALAIIGSSIEKAGKSLVISIIDNILNRVPAIRNIYGIVKKITELFKPNSKDDKKEVVLVEYPKKDLWVPAYVLSKYDGVLVIFVPTSPNPTSGYTVIVDKSQVKETSYTVAEASQFIVSMGADFVKKEEISNIVKNTIKIKEDIGK